MKLGENRRWLKRSVSEKTPWQDLLRSKSTSEPDPGSPSAVSGGSLFGEILDFMLAPLLLVWPLSIGITFLVARSIADSPYDQAMTDRIQAIAQQMRYEKGSVVISLPPSAAAILRADEEDEVQFQVLDPLNKVVAGDASLPKPALYDFPSKDQTQFRNVVVRGREIRIAYFSVEIAERANATYLIQVSETLNKRSALANEIIKGVILPQFIILPLSVILVWVGLKRGLKSLTALQEKVRERDAGDLSPIGSKNVPEEIQPLVETFNELLERLQGSMRAQQRFIADAAHQMKTPLAGLQTQAELALRQQGSADQEQTLRQLARSAKRNARLVSQLLALARTEHQSAGLSLSHLNLTELARETSTEWANAALDKGIDLGFETDETPLFILGHPLVLRELMNNLIDNAIRYTPAGGLVNVRVYSSEIGGTRFEVDDNGPGIAAAEQTRVFDRFYRVLGAEADGSGLGLAIVKEIADQHGAQIKIFSHIKGNPDQMPHGTRLSVVFPS
jgi:two-component system, OmpR family, sensor histidine kinase TctE